MKAHLFTIILILGIYTSKAQIIENSSWKIGYDDKGITLIESLKDPFHANLLNGSLGELLVSYKIDNGIWMKIRPDKRVKFIDNNKITYVDSTIGNSLSLIQTFELIGEKLNWKIDLINNSGFPIEIGDLAFNFPWRGGGDTKEQIFEQGFTKHASIAGDVSFLYFTRHSGIPPYFILSADKGTHLEYYDTPERKYQVYAYSGKAATREKRGTWRQEQTSKILNPNGDKVSLSFTFHVADGYGEMRNIIFENDLIDIQVVPGLTVPENQKAKFALKTKCSIDSIIPEFPESTLLKYLGEKNPQQYIYEVEFKKLGENKLIIHFDGNRKTQLEFFSCESPETLLKKRSAFLVNHQQFKDKSKWYDGLYGVYDMKNGQLRGPDNPDMYDEILTYFLASDDPILGKAPFIASKNVVFPDDKEIASLEYHIENFVWGKLQRTDKENPYPYGVYGTPNWYINRHQDLRELLTDYKLNTMRVWRNYDYPHMIMLYYHMYEITKLYPEKSKYLDAKGYLERAYGTAKAFFTYPDELLGDYYETFKWGNYNELIIVKLIDELEKTGQKSKANALRTEWEKKVKYFIYDDKYPFRSEYALDRTAFESSYALAKYAMQNDMKPDENLWYDKNNDKWYSHPEVTKQHARDFMERQHYANLSCRGVLENQWPILGSDFVYSSDGNGLTYMSRMGGWSILDYAINFADNPHDWIKLGYASYMASFGLINSGNKNSNYGFWYPGIEKDGAMGQGYTAVKFGHPWIGTEEARGPWRYCGEGDLGMCAVTRMATAMLVDDPIFGWTVLGGNLQEDNNYFHVFPDDGCRIRFNLIGSDKNIELELERDNFSNSQPISINKNFSQLIINLESSVERNHSTTLKIKTNDNIKPELYINSKKINPKKDKYGNYLFVIPVNNKSTEINIMFKAL